MAMRRTWASFLLRQSSAFPSLVRRKSSAAGSGWTLSVPVSYQQGCAFQLRPLLPTPARLFCSSSAPTDVPSPPAAQPERSSPVLSSPVLSVPLSVPLPGLPEPVYAKASAHTYETAVTTLENGLRVASQPKFGQFCTVGVVLDAGSRYEVAYPGGISHFLERLAFQSTMNFKGREDIMTQLEQFGGICDCQASRDTMIYAASVEVHGLEPVMRILADVALRPLLTAEEISEVRKNIAFELEDISKRPDQEALLTEMIHAAAYRGNTLGLPRLCPEEVVEKVSRSQLFTFLKHHHGPSRMVVAGVGVEHEALVELARKYFVDELPVWDNPSYSQDLEIQNAPGLTVDSSTAQFTGGSLIIEKDLSNMLPGPSPFPELTHFVLALESSSHQDPDFVPFCVLNMMMGGGGSFSAGGPGKGMYTRLYTNVLNRYHWMYSATAYNHAYADSGIFCIHASSPPKQLGATAGIIVKEFVHMAGEMEEGELERAKAQLQSMLLMNLEVRPVIFEDIGRQVLAHGARKSPEHYIDVISKVTADDIQRVARRLLKSKAAVVALGNVSELPKLEDIEAGLADPQGNVQEFCGGLEKF
ncbi:unnamed protein product [Cyprideis torosa]|uniref:Mitochondrial-processing peptidase subunit alpha n=1 Tax=Cyprideis torosa TaxID=163714 RepID=A0A7R8WEC2_9CRUS|nr:unnamed protein product [Cyprideis torosa]CAG0894191.1 unnamed protein product [Cyprideis torosa]